MIIFSGLYTFHNRMCYTNENAAGRSRVMKFKTRLRVTLIIIIVLPLALTAMAFCGIGLYLINAQKGLPISPMDYTVLSENLQEVVRGTDRAYNELLKQAKKDPSRLEDKGYLEMVNSEIARKSTYILVRNLGMLNSIWALVLPGALPIFNVILLMNFFLGIPKSLEEAALIDGASPFQVLLKIMIPCAKPCLATVSLFSIVGSWNDFFSGLIYMQKLEDYPIMTYIKSLNVDIQQLLKSGASSSTLENVTELSNRNLNAAKIVVAVIPLLMIYPILQKYLITGMVMGSVKE